MSSVADGVKRHLIPGEHNAYQPHFLRHSWLAFFVCIILATEGFLVANLAVRQSNVNFLAAVVPGEIIALTNQQRAQNNVPKLKENAALDAAAQAQATDMAQKGYFAHISPSGILPWAWILGAGYNYSYAGENLAMQFVDSKDVINAWMASPSHRANILKSDYSNIGVGVAQGIYEGQPTTFVVQYFAAPASASNGAAVAPSFSQSLLQYAAHIEGEPLSVTQWILLGIAALILLALILSFFIHPQIQSTRALLAGSAVLVFALFFLLANSALLSGSLLPIAQPAGVILSLTDHTQVTIDPVAAEDTR